MLESLLNQNPYADAEQVDETMPTGVNRLPTEIKERLTEVGYDADYVEANDSMIDFDDPGSKPLQGIEYLSGLDVQDYVMFVDSARELMPRYRERPPKSPVQRPDNYMAEATYKAYQKRIDEYVPDEELTDLDAIQFGLELMSKFDTQPETQIGAIIDMADDQTSGRERAAFAYLMNAVENKDITWDGFKRGAVNAFQSPVNAMGLTGFANALVARYGGKVAGKQLMKRLMPDIVAGIEGGAFASLDDLARQQINIEADLQEDIDPGQLAIATGTGVVAGVALSELLPQLPKVAGKAYTSFADTFNTMVENAQSGVLGSGPVVGSTARMQRNVQVQRQGRGLIEGDEEVINSVSVKSGINAEEIRAELIRLRKKYPTTGRDGWAPFEVKAAKRVNGELRLELKEVPYAYNRPADADKAPMVPDAKMVRKVANKMVKEVVDVVSRAAAGDQAAQVIMANKDWYRQMRSRLRFEFGGFADVFGDVIGATSAQTNVQQNWENSIDVLRQFSRGNFDNALGKLDAWMKAGGRLGSGKADGDGYVDHHYRVREEYAPEAKKLALQQLTNVPAGKAKDKQVAAIVKQLTTAKANEEFPLIAKESGALYNTNSPQTMMALLDLFRIKEAGGSPKTWNFTGNLLGYSDLATIDVWAARAIRRMSGMKRIVPGAESGVSGAWNIDATDATGEFGFGQEVFKQAAEALRKKHNIDLGDDDLQAVVWFLEKERWMNAGHTTRAGEGGSLEFEADLAGAVDPAAMKEARSAVAGDPTAKKRRDLAAALKDGENLYQENLKRMTELEEFAAAKTPAKQRDLIMQQMGITDKKRAMEHVKAMRTEVSERRRFIKSFEGKREKLPQMEAEQVAKVEAGQEFIDREAAPVRRFTAGLSQDVPTKVATDQMMNDGQRRMGDIMAPDDSVIMYKFNSGRGRYIDPEGKAWDERSIDSEYVARQDHNPAEIMRQVVQEAKDANQESAFFAEVVQPGTIPDANPGMEVYFNRTLTKDEVDELTKKVNQLGLDVGFTYATDTRYAQRMAAGAESETYVGLRMQYIPELAAGRDDAEATLKAMDDMVEKVGELDDLDFVANAQYVEYDTEIWFRDNGDYDAELGGSLPASRRARWREQQGGDNAQEAAGRPDAEVSGEAVRERGSGSEDRTD